MLLRHEKVSPHRRFRILMLFVAFMSGDVSAEPFFMSVRIRPQILGCSMIMS